MPNSRTKPQLYYTMESAANWLRLALAAVAESIVATRCAILCFTDAVRT
ncbi:MAG TPA: hypothetical protein VMU40_15565 [Steroidobacteraceae bacterium]|nr:hypothetical protein [Steroidobacteraceae bacterium]